MLIACTCQKGAKHSRNNILIEFMRRAGGRCLGLPGQLRIHPQQQLVGTLFIQEAGTGDSLSDTQTLRSSILRGFLSGPALQLAPLLGSCYFAFPGRGHSWKSPFRKNPFSLSLEDSVRVRRGHRGRDCASCCFSFHDSKERDSSDLPGSIANARAVLMGPKVGRCKWNTESNNKPSCLASSEAAPVGGTPGPALSSTSQ